MSTTDTVYFYTVTQTGKGKNGKKRREGGREEGGKGGGREKLFQIAFQIQTIPSAVTYLFGEYKFDLLKQPKGI